MCDWRVAGQRALRATVIRTWGSSPRPVGAMMALHEDGRIVGSVSGGCIEDDLINRYSLSNGGKGIPFGTPEVVRYGVPADEAHRFGLPCGGTLELFLEFDPPQASMDALVSRLSAGELVRRIVYRSNGAASLGSFSASEGLQFDGERLENTFGPEYRMLLVGAGALAEYLSIMALFNGFAVTIYDPRAELTGTWSVPRVQITTKMPDDAVVAFLPDRRSCVVALSHDQKLDDLALLEALHSSAFYVGAIGSRRNCWNRRERMIAHLQRNESFPQIFTRTSRRLHR